MEEKFKKKYKFEEVISLINGKKAEYEGVINGLKERLKQLFEENKRLRDSLNEYEEKQSAISTAIIDSEQKAIDIENKSQLQYELVVKRLANFSERWDNYFKALQEKYPLYPFVEDSVAIKKRLDDLLKNGNDKKTVDELDSELTQNEIKYGEKVFNPQEKINEYIKAQESDNGFSLEEVLNPGELKLEDLCKELGLIEEE